MSELAPTGAWGEGEPKLCPYCGEIEDLDLLEVWDFRDFQITACCEERYLEAVEDLQDPKAGAQLLRELGIEELGQGRIRRVADGGLGHLILDWQLEVRPIARDAAKDFVRKHHEHSPPPAGWRFGAGIWNGPDLVGVVMVGRPVARRIDHLTVVEVNRLCVRRDLPDALRWNACSQLYGWAAREAKRRGFARIITYTLESEIGTSLAAAGWTRETKTRGGSWNRSGRARQDRSSIEPKIRWARQLMEGAPSFSPPSSLPLAA